MAETEKPTPDLGEQIRRYGPAVAIGAGAVAATTGIIELPPWAIESIKQWGPAGVLILGVAYYVPRDTIPTFVKAQQDQAVAMASIAEGLKTLPQKDEMRFQEILIGQEMVNERLEAIAEKIDELKERVSAEGRISQSQ